MSEENKKEYFKKHFIQPLTESLPISNEYFSNNIDQYLSANESLANYINFDIKEITNEAPIVLPDPIDNDNAKFNEPEEIEIEILEDIVVATKTSRNANLKCDAKVELDCNPHIKDEKENNPFVTYEKNYRKVVIFDYISKFKSSLIPEIWDIPYCLGLITNEYDLLDENLPLDNFRGLDFTPPISSKSSKNIEKLLTTISVKNIFENNIEYISSNNSQREVKHAHIEFPENIREDYDNMNIEEEVKEDKKLLEEEKCKKVNAEIQTLIEEYLIYINFRLLEKLTPKTDFSINNMTKDIIKLKEFGNNSTFRAKCTLIFYNLLNLAQSKQILLKQLKNFDKIFFE